MMCGVLQGTILGSILFITYVNDSFKLKSIKQVICYVHDPALLFPNANVI